MREAPLIDSPARLVLASPSQQAANDYFKEKVQALPQAQQDVFYSLRCSVWPLPLPASCLIDGISCSQASLIAPDLTLCFSPGNVKTVCNLASCTWCSDWRNEQAGLPKTAYHVFRSNALPKGELMPCSGAFS